jgi:hypothetical protein
MGLDVMYLDHTIYIEKQSKWPHVAKKEDAI